MASADEPQLVSGWVKDHSAGCIQVGNRWVGCATGAIDRPQPGQYTDIEIDNKYVVDFTVRAWRLTDPNLN